MVLRVLRLQTYNRCSGLQRHGDKRTEKLCCDLGTNSSIKTNGDNAHGLWSLARLARMHSLLM